MAMLTNMDTNRTITCYISLEERQSVNGVVQTALDGTYYLQRIGSPAVTYEVTAYVDRTGKTQLETAEATAALLMAEVKHGTYYGRIIELKTGDRLAGDWFKADVRLAKEEGQ